MEVIAVLGGTGALGSGLARRWAKAGHRVVIGSREAAKAEAAAAELSATGLPVSGASNRDAASQAQVAVLAVPFDSQLSTLEQAKTELAGKVLIDCTVPLRPPKVGTVRLPPEGSAAQIGQAFLGPDVRVVSAFQNIGAALLQSDAASIDCDVLVCSDDDAARALGVRLAEAVGLRAFQAGPLANAAASEALTSVLIQVNRRYKAKHAGLRLTGLPGDHAAEAGLSFKGLSGLPAVAAGDDLAALILAAVAVSHAAVRPGDVFIIAQKVVSKAAGLHVDLAGVEPSDRARELGAQTAKDPKFVEVVLRESTAVIALKPGVLITEHVAGPILANAGVDRSNVDPALGGEPVLLLPRDPDAAAAEIRDRLCAELGFEVGVIINDSWGRPWRMGTVGAALGVAGLAPLHDYRGRNDLFGRELVASVEAVADELAGAANIVMGQADEGVPVVIASGFRSLGAAGAARDLVRPKAEDLFR